MVADEYAEQDHSPPSGSAYDNNYPDDDHNDQSMVQPAIT
jgi:hypothetical protein